MSKNWWPGGTATPPPDGTHWVIKRNVVHPMPKWFLLIPETLRAHPRWSTERDKAGVWSKPGAELLAALHRDANDGISEVWAEWIDPAEII